MWPCSVQASGRGLQPARDAAACHKETGSRAGLATERRDCAGLARLSFLTAEEPVISHQLHHNLLLPRFRRKMQLL